MQNSYKYSFISCLFPLPFFFFLPLPSSLSIFISLIKPWYSRSCFSFIYLPLFAVDILKRLCYWKKKKNGWIFIFEFVDEINTKFVSLVKKKEEKWGGIDWLKRLAAWHSLDLWSPSDKEDSLRWCSNIHGAFLRHRSRSRTMSLQDGLKKDHLRSENKQMPGVKMDERWWKRWWMRLSERVVFWRRKEKGDATGHDL